VIEDAWNHLHLRSLRGLHFTSILPSISKGLTQLHIPGKIVHDPSSGETNGTNGDYDHSLSANGIIGKQKSTPRLLLWSAADKDGITRLIHAHNDYFQNHQHKAQDCRYLDNLVHTLLMHRSVFDWRAFSVITDPNQLLQLDGITSSALKSEDSSDLGFVFTGQGAQWPGMGHELMAVPAFHESILRSDEYLRHLGCDWSLLGK
jgi:acyl transferase domain-containing protein